MLAVAANDLVAGDNPEIARNTVVNLNSYTCNFLQNRRILICLEMDVVEHAEEKIGSPVGIDEGNKDEKKDVKPVIPAPKAAAKVVAKPAPAKKPVKPKSVGTNPIYPIGSLSPYQNKFVLRLSSRRTLADCSTQVDDQGSSDCQIRSSTLDQREGRRKALQRQSSRRVCTSRLHL